MKARNGKKPPKYVISTNTIHYLILSCMGLAILGSFSMIFFLSINLQHPPHNISNRLEQMRGTPKAPSSQNTENTDKTAEVKSENVVSENSSIKFGSAKYQSIRKEYDRKNPPDDNQRLLSFAESMRKRSYIPMHSIDEISYDVFDCPAYPPDDYPKAWSVRDVINNWNPDNPIPPPSVSNEKTHQIYQGLCVFDYAKDFHKAENYRLSEKPFVLRNDPAVLQVVQRWNQPEYLLKQLGYKNTYRTEYSENNHFMYWKPHKRKPKPEGWKPPTENIMMSFGDWLENAEKMETHFDDEQVRDEYLSENQKPHWYFRLNGIENSLMRGVDKAQREGSDFVHAELPFFAKKQSFYIVEPEGHRGVNCRFGMKGVMAETHFDGSRNMIAVFGGERRYILAHPKQCINLELYQPGHPSARHTAVAFGNPDYEKFPHFKHAQVNEIVLQAGDVLYLPTYWFHHIISLNLNYQCNVRSGTTHEYAEHIRNCGQ